MGQYVTVAQQRQQRAEVLAQLFASWISVTNRRGEIAFGIPSQLHAGKFHISNLDHCSCKDASYRSGPCKHRRAVKLACERFGLLEPRLSRRNGFERLNGHAAPPLELAYAF